MDGLFRVKNTDHALKRFGTSMAMLMVGVVAGGCTQWIGSSAPAPIRPFVEPEFGRDYLLYRPSNYDRRFDWPLIVVCHTSFPDSPRQRLNAWADLAESYGFLVAAPTLRGVKRIRAPRADKQVVLQRYDERAILSMVRHIRGGHNISEDRIFIHGWSGGAYAALHTGLRNPDTFRAVSLMFPRFDDGFLGEAARFVSPDQPIALTYNMSDAITGKCASRCLRWLRSHGADVRPDPSGALNSKDMHRPISFFENVLRTEPWIHIRAVQGANREPLEIQFKIRGSYRPAYYRWDFGDGTTSSEAEPAYSYRKPGTYLVTLTVGDKERTEHRRAIRLSVPSGAIEFARANSKARP